MDVCGVGVEVQDPKRKLDSMKIMHRVLWFMLYLLNAKAFGQISFCCELVLQKCDKQFNDQIIEPKVQDSRY